MKINVISAEIKNRVSKLSRKMSIAILAGIASTALSSNVLAIEANIAMHQGSDSNTQGFSLLVSDNVSKSSNFYWGLGYSNLDDVKVEWNNAALFFKVDTLDAIVSYRYQPKTYNQFMRRLTVDYQIGTTYTLTENKFIWPALNEERYFSEKGDVNVLMGLAVHYNTSKNSALNIGFKYQPSFSELDDITSVYLGFTYKFGKQIGY
jgi:hypothetical protein